VRYIFFYIDGNRFYPSNEEHKGIFKKTGIHSAVLKIPGCETGYNADIVDYTDDPQYPFELYGYDYQLEIRKIKHLQPNKSQIEFSDEMSLTSKAEV